MKNLLCNRFNIPNNSLSTRTVGRMVRMCNFKKKRCIPQFYQRNNPEVIEKRYYDTLSFIVNMNTQVIFIDESDFNNNIIPIFGWARKGEKCVKRVAPQHRNTSIVAAISQSEILGFQIFRGSVNARDFGCFLINLIECYPEILENQSLLLCDNASVHKAQILQNLLQILHHTI
jgi:hypothetical protein